MCELCKHFFADPESDESMPISIGCNTVFTDNDVVIAHLNVSSGFTYTLEDKKHTSRVIASLSDGSGHDLASVDIPIKFCPFCGAELP